jgi:hypothetical protein
MAEFTKFYSFVEALAEGKHDLGTAALKVMLTNTAPVQTDAVAADITEIAAGNGYTAGGNTAGTVSSSQTDGTYRLICNDPTAWTASGGTIGPFRYAVLYNSSATNDELIGYWDYGVATTLQSGESFVVDFDPTTGVLSIA